jgi:hypothetical protein
MIKQLIKDIDDINLPKDTDSYEKIKVELKFGQRITWYFKEDLEFYKRERISPRKYAGYSGIIITAPDKESGGILDPDICVVIEDRYPCEKCNPEVAWFSLKRLLDNPDLIEIF